jgi:hypothetical protein
MAADGRPAASGLGGALCLAGAPSRGFCGMRPTTLATVWLFCALMGSANACFSDDSHQTIFYKIPPTPPAGLIVAKIIITRLIFVPTERYRSDLGVPVGSYVAEANVTQVLKGEMTDDNITVVARGTDCDDVLKVGASGVVVGRLQQSPQGTRQLLLIPQSVQDGH